MFFLAPRWAVRAQFYKIIKSLLKKPGENNGKNDVCRIITTYVINVKTDACF